MFGRQKIAMVVAEFLSTATLATITLAMIGRTNFPFFLAVTSGLTVGLMHYLWGTHSNPVITLGLWTMRRVQTTQAIVAIAAQMLGGLAAWQLSQYLINSDLSSIANATFDWRIVTAEALGAFILAMGVATAATRAYDSARQAVAIGGSLAVGILVASLASNSLLNPAVAVGVQSWSWAYAAAPILGGLVGVSLYGLLFTEGPLLPARSRKPVVATKAVARKTAAKRVAKPVAKKAAPRRRK